jgi:hypothetical protein
MGNSESTNNNSDPDENCDNVGFWKKASNIFVLVESAVYIVNHLFRIYGTLKDPNVPYSSHSTPFYYSFSEPQIQQTQIREDPQEIRRSPNIPVVPEGSDTPVNDNDNENECIICTVNRKNTIFIPCGHIALCIQCSNEYYNRNSNDFKCVICKQMCTHIQKIFTC